MNIPKVNPAGVDISITAYQNYFYGQMKTRFGITDDTAFDLYGRAHNNPRDGGSVPEVLGANGEYFEVLFNDTKTVGQGFWIVGDRVDYLAGSASAKVAMILEYNMNGITGGPYNPMHDEQVNQVLMDIVRRPRFGFVFTALVKRIDNIFREYPKWKDTTKFADMYPWHCLRLEFDLIYNISGTFNCTF